MFLMHFNYLVNARSWIRIMSCKKSIDFDLEAVYACMQVLDDTFASQMQQLLGNAIQEKDMEAPRCIMEVRSMLCKDAPNHKDNSFYY